MNPFTTYRRIRRLLNPLGATPPAAEGGRPGGEAAATPLAAPRRDADGGER
jgi:hypothetical protein